MFVLGLPGRIAIARNHPDADAVNLMGWVGFVAVVPWIKALIWAFKPTDVIDISNLPETERRETHDMIARLRGKVRAPAPRPHPSRRSPGRQTAMMIAILVLIVAAAIFWLIFFKFKLPCAFPWLGVHFCVVRDPRHAGVF